MRFRVIRKIEIQLIMYTVSDTLHCWETPVLSSDMYLFKCLRALILSITITSDLTIKLVHLIFLRGYDSYIERMI